ATGPGLGLHSPPGSQLPVFTMNQQSPSPHPALAAARSALLARAPRLRDLFDTDPGRQARFSLEDCGIYYDFSREWLDEDSHAALLRLAHEAALPQAIAALFAGAAVNNTEARPALHVAL